MCSQDTDAEVRMCMCEQLDAISRSVGFDTFMVIIVATESAIPAVAICKSQKCHISIMWNK